MQPNDILIMTDLVREFMLAFEQPTYPDVEQTPSEAGLFRSVLIKEEASEYSKAPMRTEAELDALCDLLYVVLGTAITMSVQVLPVVLKQVPVIKAKPELWSEVLCVTQDLDCKFPCKSLQFREQNRLILAILKIAMGYGYDFFPAFKEVHKTNIEKLWSSPPENTENLLVTPKGNLWLVKRVDGKIMKPPTFRPPELKEYL